MLDDRRATIWLACDSTADRDRRHGQTGGRIDWRVGEDGHCDCVDLIVYNKRSAERWIKKVFVSFRQASRPNPRMTVSRRVLYCPVGYEVGDAKARKSKTALRIISGHTVHPVTINATLTLYPGPDGNLVRDRAVTALTTWVEANRMLGMNLRRSAIFSKLHQEGVHSVDLISPAADLVLGPTEVYAVEAINITVADLRDA